jgi:phage terminase small subunit
MAGAKGRSGGARHGAGRPPKERDPDSDLTIATSGNQTPLEFLLTVMNDNMIADKLRLEAAKTAAQYVHPKKGESSGSKDAAAEAAKNASTGKFGMREPPKLAAAGGKTI